MRRWIAANRREQPDNPTPCFARFGLMCHVPPPVLSSKEQTKTYLLTFAWLPVILTPWQDAIKAPSTSLPDVFHPLARRGLDGKVRLGTTRDTPLAPLANQSRTEGSPRRYMDQRPFLKGPFLK
jgi:hypothetical protein